MTLEDRLDLMLAFLPDDYDTSVGSFFYDILYPVAEKLTELESNVESMPDKVFALTATGEYLDRRAAEQGIERTYATYAEGILTITGDPGSIVHDGSLAATEDILFSTQETVTIPDTGTITVRAVCAIPGVRGNVAAGTITRFPISLPGLRSVTNVEPFTGGYDAESDDNLRERYFEKVSRPNASGNKNDYIKWAKEVAGVGDVQVIPLWNGPGTVKVVITDSDTQPADEELIEAVLTHIEENRPIGAEVTVVSASALIVNISAKLTKTGDLDVQKEVEAVIKEYLSEYALEKAYISYARIGSLILSVSVIEDYSDLKVNDGMANVEIPDGTVPVLGSVELT